MLRILAGLACLLTALASTDVAAGDEELIATIKIVRGEVLLEREGESLPVSTNMVVLPGDTFLTGEDGSLGMLFRDDSMLSLGPETVFVIEDFSFAPAEQKYGFFGRILSGTISYLSGLIGKLSPESVRFETPNATIGIRGTKFAVQVQ